MNQHYHVFYDTGGSVENEGNVPEDGEVKNEKSEINKKYLKNFLPFDPSNWLKLHVLNVGQGDCLILEFPRKKETDGEKNKEPFVMVIDHKGKNVDLARGYLEEFIGFNPGSPMIFVVSHAHYDHIEKAVEFIEYFHAFEIWISPLIRYFTSSYYKLIASATRNRIPIYTITDSDKISLKTNYKNKLNITNDDPLSKIEFEIFNPPNEQFKYQDLKFTWDKPITKYAVSKARSKLEDFENNQDNGEENDEGHEEEELKKYSEILGDLKVPNPKNSPYAESHTKMDELITALEHAFESDGKIINNSSIVLQITYGERTLLLSGDAEFNAWEHIILNHFNNEKYSIDLFKVPHHGGECDDYFEETTEDLTKPMKDLFNFKFAVISVGYHEKHQHPRETTLTHLENQKNVKINDKQYRVYRTDDLAQKSFHARDYNGLPSWRGKKYAIFSYIFGIIPNLKEEKGIIYPYRVMIKQDQYSEITNKE